MVDYSGQLVISYGSLMLGGSGDGLSGKSWIGNQDSSNDWQQILAVLAGNVSLGFKGTFVNLGG